MSSCCDPNAPKVLYLNVGGDLVGLVGVEQAFGDVINLGLNENAAAEKLLETVKRKNYIIKVSEPEYKLALFAAFKNYLSKNK